MFGTPMEMDALFDSFDPDGSGEITFRELYKMIRHNPDGTVPMAPKVVHHAKAVVPVELPDLRSKVKLELFKMELSAEVMHAKELLKGEKRPGHGVLNPTIVI